MPRCFEMEQKLVGDKSNQEPWWKNSEYEIESAPQRASLQTQSGWEAGYSSQPSTQAPLACQLLHNVLALRWKLPGAAERPQHHTAGGNEPPLTKAAEPPPPPPPSFNGCRRHVTAVARTGALGSAHAPCAGTRGTSCEGRRRPLPGRAARWHHVVRPRPLRQLPGSGGGPRLPMPAPPPGQRRGRQGERWVRLAAGGGAGVRPRVWGSVRRQPGSAGDAACRGRCRLGVPRLQALLCYCWGTSDARPISRTRPHPVGWEWSSSGAARLCFRGGSLWCPT